MAEQNQQEIAPTKESNDDTDQNVSNVSKENKKTITENEDKIDTNSINDMTPSTSETVNKKEDENPKENLLEESKNLDENKSDTNLINTNGSPSTGETVVTVKDEDPKENLLSKNLDENKSDANFINTNGSPSAGETVNRKVTVEDEDPKVENNSDNSKNDATNSTPSTGETVETVDVAIPPKKKKKKKKKKKAGEDDASIDFHDSGPREEDEDRLYHPSKSLTYRIEMAVQKYKKNRKFSTTRNQVFNSYLRFGGISTGPKSFLGQDGIDNADADAEEIAMRRATEFIDDEAEDLEVNFTYIVGTYLSSFLIDKSGYVQMDQFREAPQVVISFLNYLLNHKVCPEHEDDMQEALKIAHQAKDELPSCKALAHNSPGKLNKACSLLFGGELYGMLDDPWNGEETVALMIGISKAEGKRLIRELFGISAVEELTLEDSRISLPCKIIGVEPFSTSPTDETHQNSSGENPVNTSEDASNETHQSADEEKSNSDELRLKKILLREYDVSTAEPFYVYVNSDLGNHAMPEMRVTADFHKLSNGFWYWDKVTNVYPSYYQPCEDDSDDDD